MDSEELKRVSDFLVVSSSITRVDSQDYTVLPTDELVMVTSKTGCYITLPAPEYGKKLIIKDGSGFSSKYQIIIVDDNNKKFYLNSSFGSLRFLSNETRWEVLDNHYGFGKLLMKQNNVCSNGILYDETTFISGNFTSDISIENRNGTVIRNGGGDQKWNVMVNFNKDNNFTIHVGDKIIDNKKDVIVDIKNGDTFWVSVMGIIDKSSIAIIQVE